MNVLITIVGILVLLILAKVIIRPHNTKQKSINTDKKLK